MPGEDVSTLIIKVDTTQVASANSTLAGLSKSANSTGAEATKLGAQFAAASKDIATQAAKMGNAFLSGVKPMQDINKAIEDSVSPAENYNRRIAALDAAFKAYKITQDELKERTEAINAAFEEGRKIAESVATPYEKFETTIADLGKVFDAGTISQETYAQAMKKAEAELVASVGAAGNAEAAIKSLTDASGEVGVVGSRMGEALKSSAAVAGGELEKLKNEFVDGAITAEKFEASAAALAKTFGDGKALMEQYQAPLEKYNQKLAELNEMHRRGAIDTKTYEAATVDAKNQMQQASGVSNDLVGNIKKLAGAVGLATVAWKAYGFGVNSIAAGQKTAITDAKLDAVMKANAGAIGLTTAQLHEQSRALADMSVYSEVAIKDAQAMLVTFNNISGEVFPRAIQSIADMANVFGSLESGALQVGKALDNPVQGLTALRRVGFTFSDDFKNVIETLVNSGKMAEAQTKILGELEKQFGGVSKAISETPSGQLDKLRNQFGDLQSELGQKLIPVMVEFQKIINAVTKLMIDNVGVAIGIATGGLVMLIPAAKAAAISIGLLNTVILANPFFLAGAGVAVGITAITLAIKAFNREGKDTAEIARQNAEAEERRRIEYQKTITFLEKVTGRIGAANDLIREHNEKMMSDTDRALNAVGKTYDEKIADIRARIKAIDEQIEIRVVTTEKDNTVTDEYATLQKQLTDLLAAKQRERTKIISDANKQERDERASILQSMGDDLLGDYERQYAQLERETARRRSLFKADAVEQQAITSWNMAQLMEIDKKRGEEEWAAAKESAAAYKAVTDSMLTDSQRLTETYKTQRQEMIADAEKWGFTEADIQKNLSKLQLEYLNAQDAAYAAEVANKNKLLGIEQTATQKITAEYNARIAALENALMAGDITKKQFTSAELAAQRQLAMGMESLWLQSDAARISAMRDGYEKQIAMATLHYNQERAQLESMNLTKQDFAQREIALAQQTADAISAIRMQQFQDYAGTAQGVLGQIGAVESQYYSNKMTTLENNHKKELAMINESGMSEKAKRRAIRELDEKTQAERESVVQKQFAIEKALGISNATINTALAVTKALTAAPPPFNFALATAVGALGAAQIGLIASAPRPMDSGGMLAAGDYAYVGEKRPEIVTGGALIRGPASVTSGAETASILAAAAGGGGGGTTSTTENNSLVINFTDDRGSLKDQLREGYLSGDIVPVIREILRGEGVI